jgi:hypothetical protein
MAAVLHLLKGADPDLAQATIVRQLAAGDHVTVAVLQAAPVPDLPKGVAVFRIPDDLSYEALLETIFEAEQVIAW